MKKALLVAASLFTTASAVTTGEAVKASPQFQLSQSTAGNLIFQGVGTAQYNNSIGTNNSFQVGSSTNLGVNASTSSTPEYAVTSHARLDLASNSNLSQVIGTSGASDTTTAETMAAMDKAQSEAQTEATKAGTTAQTTFEASHGDSFSDFQQKRALGTYSPHAYMLGIMDREGYTDVDQLTSSQWEEARTDTVTTAEESVYQSTYDSTYSSLESAMSTRTSDKGSTGIIKGTFTTEEYGEAGNGSTMGDWQTASTKAADEKVKVEFEADYAAYNAANTGQQVYVDSSDYNSTLVAGEAGYEENLALSGEAKWKAAKLDAHSTAYNEAYADAVTQSSRTSSSDVEVTGIGSDASVTSKSSSTFDVLISSTLGGAGAPSDAESTATATGAAGANLSTSSFANQSQASTASAFMQAFGGDADATADALTKLAREGYTANSNITASSDIDRALATGNTFADAAAIDAWIADPINALD